MATDDWGLRGDAIVEQPRSVRKHPLLSAIYGHHDDLIAEFLPDGEALEIACGQYVHPQADVGLEALPANVRAIDRSAVAGDARGLPFADDSFAAVIGRRFLHHVPDGDRREILTEVSRVLEPGGRLVVLEGTPGLYRRLTKGVAFRLGLLGDDSDVYGHLSREELVDLLATEYEVVADRSLGSPLAVAGISESDLSRHLLPVYRRTQFVEWWTLAVGDVE